MTDGPDLRASLGAVPIERDIVRVHGPEAVEYLQGQLSQDVAGAPVEWTGWSLLLQPTGKVEAWLRATRLGEDDVLLDVTAGFGEAVHARLRRFKLRTKADLDLASWSGFALRGPGAEAVPAPTSGLRLAAAWPGVESVDVLAEGGVDIDGVPAATLGALEALRIECGVPEMGAELTEATIPAEAGRWLIDTSVSFSKGCYTGQELVARVDSRGGNVPRPIRGLRVDGDAVPVGAQVRVDPASDATVGTVTSSATSATLGAIALAPIARTVELGQSVELRWDGGTAAAVVAALPL